MYTPDLKSEPAHNKPREYGKQRAKDSTEKRIQKIEFSIAFLYGAIFGHFLGVLLKLF